MNKLMTQLRDPRQTKGRSACLKPDWYNRTIQFTRDFQCKVGNLGNQYVTIRVVFAIDTKPTEWGNDPVVTSPYVNRYPALGHTNHLYRDHSLCLGHGLYNWNLFELLRQIEKWFGGFYEWTKSGNFLQSQFIYA